MIVNETLQAGVGVDYGEKANFFRLLAAEDQTVSVKFYRNGAEVADVSGIGAGYAEKFDDPFDKFRVTVGATQAIKIVTRLGNDVRYDTPPVGNVAITNTPNVVISGVTGGPMQVYPYGKTRVAAGGGFIGGVQLNATTGSNAQLWNPPASGKNIFVERVSFSQSAAASASVHIGRTVAALTSIEAAGYNKKLGGAAGSGEVRWKDAAISFTADMMAVLIAQNVVRDMDFVASPILLAPGNGFSLGLNTSGIMSVHFEWFEE